MDVRWRLGRQPNTFARLPTHGRAHLVDRRWRRGALLAAEPRAHRRGDAVEDRLRKKSAMLALSPFRRCGPAQPAIAPWAPTRWPRTWPPPAGAGRSRRRRQSAEDPRHHRPQQTHPGPWGSPSAAAQRLKLFDLCQRRGSSPSWTPRGHSTTRPMSAPSTGRCCRTIGTPLTRSGRLWRLRARWRPAVSCPTPHPYPRAPRSRHCTVRRK